MLSGSPNSLSSAQIPVEVPNNVGRADTILCMVAGLKVPVLMYHRIGPGARNSIVKDQYVPESLFRRQLSILASKGYRSISLTQMLDLFDSPNARDKAIVITFDDGYRSFIEKALPILKSHGMKATVFAVSNCVGQTNRWDEAKGDVTEPLMSAIELREIVNQGMSLGGHTRTHPDLRFCDDSLAAEEIAGCKSELERAVQTPIEWFSYPFGKHRERERDIARKAGFRGACGTDKHSNDKTTDPFALGRINIRATTSPAYLMRKISQAARGS